MTYQYRCGACFHVFDVIKRVSDMELPEFCECCGLLATRDFVPQAVFFNGTSVENAEYNPGLGCVVRNKSHRKELAKRKGVEEIGNEPPEKIHKHFDQVREDKREQSWADLDKGWVGNGDVDA